MALALLADLDAVARVAVDIVAAGRAKGARFDHFDVARVDRGEVEAGLIVQHIDLKARVVIGILDDVPGGVGLDLHARTRHAQVAVNAISR